MHLLRRLMTVEFVLAYVCHTSSSKEPLTCINRDNVQLFYNKLLRAQLKSTRYFDGLFSNELFVVTLIKFDNKIIVKTAYIVMKNVCAFGAGDTTIGSILLWFTCIHTAISMTYLCCRSQFFLMCENNIRATSLESMVKKKCIHKFPGLYKVRLCENMYA